jgi:hypothetical protein
MVRTKQGVSNIKSLIQVFPSCRIGACFSDSNTNLSVRSCCCDVVCSEKVILGLHEHASSISVRCEPRHCYSGPYQSKSMSLLLLGDFHRRLIRYSRVDFHTKAQLLISLSTRRYALAFSILVLASAR